MSDRQRSLWVVKIGGSLAADPVQVRAWLGAVSAGRGRVVMVPGGGPFADAVRRVQADLGFDDAAAHRMALTAMAQYGAALCALGDGFALADTQGEILLLAASGRVPVWAPARMVVGAPEIAESWDVTSDSLAAWLARRLGAGRLVLVKSAARPAEGTPLAAAIDAGLVDPAIAGFVTRSCPLHCLGPGDEARLAAALAAGEPLPGALGVAPGRMPVVRLPLPEPV